MSIQSGFNQLLGMGATALRISPNFEARAEIGKSKNAYGKAEKAASLEGAAADKAAAEATVKQYELKNAKTVPEQRAAMKAASDLAGEIDSHIFKEAQYIDQQDKIARHIFELDPTQSSLDKIASVKAKRSVINRYTDRLQQHLDFMNFRRELAQKTGHLDSPQRTIAAYNRHQEIERINKREAAKAKRQQSGGDK